MSVVQTSYYIFTYQQCITVQIRLTLTTNPSLYLSHTAMKQHLSLHLYLQLNTSRSQPGLQCTPCHVMGHTMSLSIAYIHCRLQHWRRFSWEHAIGLLYIQLTKHCAVLGASHEVFLLQWFKSFPDFYIFRRPRTKPNNQQRSYCDFK